jgi:hypothetical protein
MAGLVPPQRWLRNETMGNVFVLDPRTGTWVPPRQNARQIAANEAYARRLQNQLTANGLRVNRPVIQHMLNHGVNAQFFRAVNNGAVVPQNANRTRSERAAEWGARWGRELMIALEKMLTKLEGAARAFSRGSMVLARALTEAAIRYGGQALEAASHAPVYERYIKTYILRLINGANNLLSRISRGGESARKKARNKVRKLGKNVATRTLIGMNKVNNTINYNLPNRLPNSKNLNNATYKNIVSYKNNFKKGNEAIMMTKPNTVNRNVPLVYFFEKNTIPGMYQSMHGYATPTWNQIKNMHGNANLFIDPLSSGTRVKRRHLVPVKFV